MDDTANAVGRSRSARQLHQQIRAGHALRAARRVRGRKIEDLKSDELKDILQERQDRALLSITLAGGDPAGNLGGPLWWQDQFEVNKGSRPWFVVDPTDGKIPPMTQEAQRRHRARARRVTRATRGNGADSYTDRSLYDRCITRGLPGSMMPAIYGNSYDIVQGPGFVAIRYEMVHETRVIPLDGRPHVGSTIRSHMGDARGRWEGNTLVVETTNFRDESIYRNGNPATLKLIERFTRTAAEPHRVGGDRRRSGDLDETVDVRDAADHERRGADHGIRVSRRESRDGQHPQRRAGRGRGCQEGPQVVDGSGADGGGGGAVERN